MKQGSVLRTIRTTRMHGDVYVEIDRPAMAFIPVMKTAMRLIQRPKLGRLAFTSVPDVEGRSIKIPLKSSDRIWPLDFLPGGCLTRAGKTAVMRHSDTRISFPSDPGAPGE
jgi:hypothetical protein